MRRSGMMAVFAGLALLAAGTLQGARAASGDGESLLKRLSVKVTFLDVTPEDYAKESQNIAAGNDHDALVFAALVKDGAKPVLAPELQLPERIPGRIEVSNAGDHGAQTLVTRVEDTSYCSADGSITNDLKVHRDIPAGKSSPGTSIDFSVTKTVRAGEIQMLADPKPANGADKTLRLAFLKVTLIRN